MKGMQETYVNAVTLTLLTGRSLNNTIYLRFAEMYLQCLLSGILDLIKWGVYFLF